MYSRSSFVAARKLFFRNYINKGNSIDIIRFILQQFVCNIKEEIIQIRYVQFGNIYYNATRLRVIGQSIL